MRTERCGQRALLDKWFCDHVALGLALSATYPAVYHLLRLLLVPAGLDHPMQPSPVNLISPLPPQLRSVVVIRSPRRRPWPRASPSARAPQPTADTSPRAVAGHS